MKLFFRTYGAGPPLVILHGLYGSSDNWISIAHKISSCYTVIIPDQRNHGQSPHSPVHDYESMSDDLFELVSETVKGKFFLAGHSMGGKSAVRFAMRWPEMLAGLIVADISPFETRITSLKYYNEHIDILRKLKEADISGAASREELEKMLSKHIPSSRTRGLILKNIRRAQGGGFEWKINVGALLDNLDSIIDRVKGLDGPVEPVTGFPVVFLKGEKSDYLHEEDYQGIRRLFPAVEFRMIPGAGHWLQVDNPDAVVREFLRLKEL